jgi:hypothetical protein
VSLGHLPFRDGVEAFCVVLGQRQQDHMKWLTESEASVAENRPFALTTDPHACAFGRWYDNFHTDDPWLAAAVRKLDAPRRRIHAGTRAWIWSWFWTRTESEGTGTWSPETDG